MELWEEFLQRHGWDLMLFMEGLGTTNAKTMAKGLVQMDSTAKGIDEAKFAKDLEYVFDG